MKKIKILTACMLGLATMALTSCGDAADEITSIIFNRNLSPTNLEARVTNRTNVRLIWTSVNQATSYNIEVFADDSLTFAGSPVQTIEGVTETTYTITNLIGETQYSFRVMAVTEGDPGRDSKWSGVYAKTGTEQIFEAVAAEDIQAKQVTLRWPAGQVADLITLNPGGIEYTVTAADIAAGAATITGLTPETTYTATMTYNGKTRGKIQFTTAIELAAGDVLVSTGDDIVEAINNAPEGARLIVMPGTYGIAAAEASFGGSVTISKNITIKGLRPNDMPVIQGRFKVEAPFAVDQVILDGTGTDGGQAFDFTAPTTISHLTVTNSEIKNYTKGFFYINVAALVNNITIDNSIIHDIECSGGDFFDSRKGAYSNFTLTNSTIYNCAINRDVFRMDNASSSFSGVAPVIVVDHNTFYNVGSGEANYRFFYVRFTGNKITFTNNVVYGFVNKRGFTDQASTDASPTLSGNFYDSTLNLLSLAEGNTQAVKWFDTTGVAASANFKNAAAADFTLGNEDIIIAGAGDPRWIPEI